MRFAAMKQSVAMPAEPSATAIMTACSSMTPSPPTTKAAAQNGAPRSAMTNVAMTRRPRFSALPLETSPRVIGDL